MQGEGHPEVQARFYEKFENSRFVEIGERTPEGIRYEATDFDEERKLVCAVYLEDFPDLYKHKYAYLKRKSEFGWSTSSWVK